ncbi:MAG: DNA topoisomerase I [Candidatus Micrarchaeota archaeon]|nr:DNA topoisomerase I [Candidatus Micrarchaeota archaeon]
MDTLVVAEKPSVALRLAIALGDNRQKRMSLNGVSYYQIDNPEGRVYIAPAVGHIFTLVQAVHQRGYPVLEVKWVPSYEANPKSEFTKKYLDVLKELSKKVGHYVNACDYDTEGTVIGTNVIRFVSKDGLKGARRMKFSTTTAADLKEAFSNLQKFDMNNFYAGETRHMLDWLWGINFSRALTSAVAGHHTKALSIGRVQGPTLALLATREREIGNFKPQPFWKIFATAKGVEFVNIKGEIFDRKVADAAHRATTSGSPLAHVKDVEEKEQPLRPYPPFDLTSLQLEASRVLRYDPSSTLAVAQALYERSYISYPRTASQKLPPTLGLPRIIGELAKNPKYEAKAKRLIEERRFRPNEGMKSDEAHPAIYPTGVMPKELSTTEQNVYNLIAERFLSCFAGYAKLAKSRVVVSSGGEDYSANGTKILERGWLDYYSFATLGEKELADFKKGERVQLSKIEMRELQTQPPKRYSKAALIAELEKRDLGTKATRAAVIDTLFRRAYLDGAPIKVTEFGMSVYDALRENVSMILDEETTRKLEKDMERIVEGKKTEDEVIGEGKKMLLDALKLFDSNKSKITEAMKKGLAESNIGLGKCPKDGGDLVVRRSRMGKQFAACNNYPKCTMTFSLPQGAKIVGTGKTCEFCKTPIIKVIRAGKGVFEMCLDPNCKTKEKWKSRQEEKAVAKAETAAGAAIPEKRAKRKAAPKSKKPAKATAVKAKARKPKKEVI